MGEALHLTGQAIGQRRVKLEERGIIKGYTIKAAPPKQLIRIYLDVPKYKIFEQAVMEFRNIEHLYKTHGGACYCLLTNFTTQELEQFIASIEKFGRYTIDTISAEVLR